MRDKTQTNRKGGGCVWGGGGEKKKRPKKLVLQRGSRKKGSGNKVRRTTKIWGVKTILKGTVVGSKKSVWG